MEFPNVRLKADANEVAYDLAKARLQDVSLS
jgi:hypothetical protein